MCLYPVYRKIPYRIGVDVRFVPRLIPCRRCAQCQASYQQYWGTRYARAVDQLQPLGLHPYLFTFTLDDFAATGSPARVWRCFTNLARPALPFSFKYFCACEYSPEKKRLHFHAIIFLPSLEFSKLFGFLWTNGWFCVESVRSHGAGYYFTKYALKAHVRGRRLFVSKGLGGILPEEFGESQINAYLRGETVMIKDERGSIPVPSRFFNDYKTPDVLEKRLDVYLRKGFRFRGLHYEFNDSSEAVLRAFEKTIPVRFRPRSLDTRLRLKDAEKRLFYRYNCLVDRIPFEDMVPLTPSERSKVSHLTGIPRHRRRLNKNLKPHESFVCFADGYNPFLCCPENPNYVNYDIISPESSFSENVLRISQCLHNYSFWNPDPALPHAPDA